MLEFITGISVVGFVLSGARIVHDWIEGEYVSPFMYVFFAATTGVMCICFKSMGLEVTPR